MSTMSAVEAKTIGVLNQIGSGSFEVVKLESASVQLAPMQSQTYPMLNVSGTVTIRGGCPVHIQHGLNFEVSFPLEQVSHV